MNRSNKRNEFSTATSAVQSPLRTKRFTEQWLYALTALDGVECGVDFPHLEKSADDRFGSYLVTSSGKLYIHRLKAHCMETHFLVELFLLLVKQ